MSVLITGGQVQTVIAMNTANQAITNYNNYGFSSFAKFNGVYYGANENGLYQLEGDDDNGTPIAATIRTVLSAFNTTWLKRLESCYLGLLRLNGTVPSPAVLSVKPFDKTNVLGAAQTLSSTTSGGSKVDRVKFGKGLQSNYWGVEISNVDGVDFSLDSIELRVATVRRRLR